MARISIQQLGQRLKKKRGSRGVRDVAAEVGVRAATLSRVERGNVPDLDTFAKICKWLKIDPAEVLGIDVNRESLQHQRLEATVHFRMGRTTSPELAEAVADMILRAQELLAEEA